MESVQRGLHSRSYVDGRLMVDGERSDKSEHALHHIQSLVSQALNLPTEESDHMSVRHHRG